jgi:dihydrofolate reductase
MAKITAFNFITLDGYFEGPKKGDISWHRHGGEEGQYSEESLQHDAILLFGRVTYEMMKSYWPTPMAMENDPVVAQGMNESEKIVFSKKLKKADWNNTRVVSSNIVKQMKKLKLAKGKDMAILGSGSIVKLFAENNLIDEYQFMVDPVAIGKGTPVFKNIKSKLDLKLTDTKVFKSGVVLLCYKPN